MSLSVSARRGKNPRSRPPLRASASYSEMDFSRYQPLSRHPPENPLTPRYPRYGSCSMSKSRQPTAYDPSYNSLHHLPMLWTTSAPINQRSRRTAQYARESAMTRFSVAGLLLGLSAFAGNTSSAPTFNRDVLPILQKNCQGCHRDGQIGPMPLLTYQDARPWAKAIKAAVLTNKMPPWFADPRFGHFSNERKLDQGAINSLVSWADNGAPEGNVKDRPAPVSFPTDGWNIKPDMVFSVPQPYQVPAEGIVEYTYFVIPTGFTKDTWVAAAEVLPGNRKIVHHVIAFVRPPQSQWMKDVRPGEPFVPVVHKRDANG